MLQDEDPYVRKTAAMCVAKLHDINAELVEDRGFLDSLKVFTLLAPFVEAGQDGSTMAKCDKHHPHPPECVDRG